MRREALSSAVGLVAVVLLAGWLAGGSALVSRIGVAVHGAGLVLLLAGAAAAIVLATAVISPSSRAAGPVVAIAVVALGVSAVVVGVTRGIDRTERLLDTRTIVFTDEAPPDFLARAPYAVSRALLARNSGEFTNVRVFDAAYTDPSTGEWAALVDGNGLFAGARGAVVKAGDDYRSCSFDADVDAFAGILWNDIKREVHIKRRGFTFDIADAAAVCAAEGPVVYIPTTGRAGLRSPDVVPGPLVIIESDGLITFDDEPTLGRYPVPVVSPRVASFLFAQQVRVDESRTESVFFASARRGYERPEVGGEDGNPDVGNIGEFLLYDTDGRAWFVSPMTPIGDNEEIAALGLVRADTATAGRLPVLTVHELTGDARRLSNREVEARLAADFDTDVQWEAGYSVYELAPLADGAWSASIGRDLEVKFRAVVQPDGSACLHLNESPLVDGDGLARRIRCSDEPVGGGSGGAVDVSEGIGALSDGELAELLRQVADELERRSAADGG